jgi:AcrR family transcriptional regulator
MRKGQQTRSAILESALEIASRAGLEGLTIGVLAEAMQMSKSGVFAHFGSREDLQIAVLKEYERRFVDAVLMPCVAVPRGLPRLTAIFEHWLMRVSDEIDSGCIYVSSATEYDDRPGPIRDEFVKMLQAWEKELLKAAVQALEERHIKSDIEPEQLVFQMEGLILAAHQRGRLMKEHDAIERARKGFEQLIHRVQQLDK